MNAAAAQEESPSMALAKKGKGKAKTATKEKPVKGDLIVETAHELENLKKDVAFKLVSELAENVDYTYFKLGGVLSVIQSNNWYGDEGYETFRSFVETEYGIHYRKAMYLVAIYNGLVDSGVTWDSVKGLGWTKLKELAHLLTPQNVKKWVKVASDLTVLQLIEYIKEQNKGTLEKGKDAKDSDAAAVSSMTFKVHKDQKEVIEEALEKAKGEANTEVNTVALEAICLSYMSGGKKAKAAPKKQTLAEQMGDHTWEQVLEEFEKLWPDVDISVTV